MRHIPLAAIDDAASAIYAAAVRTPLVRLDLPFAFDVVAGPEIYLKLECLQHAGSFKPRGAFNCLLSAELPATGVIAASGGKKPHVVAIDLHISELGNAPRFGFSLLSVDLNTAVEGAVAADVAPSDFSYWGYALANRPALILIATDPVAKPSRPRAGRHFTVSLPVTRSDTGRSITNGVVTCRVLAAGAKLPAQCAFVVPRAAKGKVLRGTISVRSGGKVVARDFSYVVR